MRNSASHSVMMEIEPNKPAGNGMVVGGLSSLSETLWPEKTNTEFVGDVSARLTLKDLTVMVSLSNGTTQKVLEGHTGYAVPGTLTALMGPSGSGKSTLLDALSGHLTANAFLSGTVEREKERKLSGASTEAQNLRRLRRAGRRWSTITAVRHRQKRERRAPTETLQRPGHESGVSFPEKRLKRCESMKNPSDSSTPATLDFNDGTRYGHGRIRYALGFLLRPASEAVGEGMLGLSGG
ncbi:hypothetical protein F3Y22_tig00110122pilonHSYRG00006 [Hibiscus syriacus]|uniref:ABC transporter domain-containing protein n=1 Tax=Hibiscus syriacus TaxID=106335 RepID=A0A6A3BIG6_HIBSY|nr:hypothetical protein F3Y22_tig00110122pilonHSYRG00006 [Hibiscus syriacus]